MLEKVYTWLEAGYKVKCGKARHTAIYKAGNYYRYTHFGSSAVVANKENLSWLLNTIFSHDDFFWCINSDGLMESTDEEISFYCNTCINTFAFYKRYLMSNTIEKRPFMRYADTITHMLVDMEKHVENFNQQHDTDYVHCYVEREYKENSPFNQFAFAV